MGKMLGARVPDELNEAVRRGAKEAGLSVNQYLNSVLAKALDGSPEREVPAVKSRVLETARRYRELREEIERIESSNKGAFFGLLRDPDVDKVLRALRREAKSLVKALDKAHDQAKKLHAKEGHDEEESSTSVINALFPGFFEALEEAE